MTELLVGNEAIAKKIRELFSKASEIRCAVAFWGNGAASLFGETRTKNVSLICNLTSGGTNPDEIARLIRRFGKRRIRMKNDLHSKVYWTNQGVIVASSNASSNGLALEEGETSGWVEAGVYCNDRDIIQSANGWLDTLWNESTSIQSKDLKQALSQWRRARRQRKNTKARESFLTALRAGAYNGRSIHIVVTVNFCSNSELAVGDRRAKKLKAQNPQYAKKDISYWLGYESIPRNASIFEFSIDEKECIEYEGLFLTMDKTTDVDDFQFRYPVKASSILMPQKHVSALKRCAKLLYAGKWKELKSSDGIEISMEEFTKQVLSNREIVANCPE